MFSKGFVKFGITIAFTVTCNGLLSISQTWADTHSAGYHWKKTTSGASIVNGQPKNTESFTPPTWVTEQNNVMYEMNVFRTPSLSGTVEDGTFSAAAEHIPRLAELGITIIWLMPVYELADNVHLKADFPSLYGVKNHFKIDEHVGSLSDAKAFVEKAHAHNIKVLFDYIPTQTSYDSLLLERHPDWYTQNSEGEIVNAAALRFNSFFWDIANLDPDNSAVQNYAVKVIRHWVKKLDIDGYRVDGGRRALSTAFWNRARAACNRAKRYDDCFIFGETNGPEAAAGYSRFFDGYDARQTRNTLVNFSSAAAVHQQLAYEQLNYALGAIPVRATANHDDVFSVSPDQIWGDNYFAGIVLTYTMQGLPMIVQGEDGGNLSRINLFDDTPIENDFESDTAQFIKRMGAIRTHNSALHNVTLKDGQHFFQLNNNNANNDNVYAFMRFNKENRVIVLVNLTDTEQSFSYALGASGIWAQDGTQRDIVVPGTYHNALYPEFDTSHPTLEISESRGTFASAQPNFTLTLPPHGYKIFIDEHAQNTFVRSNVSIDEFAPRWTYMGVRSPLPDLATLCNIEGCEGFAKYVSENSEEINSLLNSGVNTFIVEASDTLADTFNIHDSAIEGLFYTATAIVDFCGFFDNPGDALGVPNNIDVLDVFGATTETLSGKTLSLSQPNLFGTPYCEQAPLVNIDGETSQLLVGNRVFVYTDNEGNKKYGLLHLTQAP